MRGRKMVLNYTNGSPCPDPLSDAHDTAIATDVDVPTRRKTTLVSLLCERDPLMPLLTLSFVGSPDECTYVFEARSSAACPGIERARQTLGPAGVFGVLAAVALLVYVVGGCVYSRTVLHQRGWRQLPNYALWAGIFAFFRVSAPLPALRGVCVRADMFFSRRRTCSSSRSRRARGCAARLGRAAPGIGECGPTAGPVGIARRRIG